MTDLLDQYRDHARRYPAEVLESALNEMLAQAEWADITWDTGAEVARLIRQAIETETPYSTVRVGDGTGNFLGYGDPVFAGLKAYSQQAILQMTFGTSDFSETEVGRIREGLISGILTADILGVSDLFRLGRLKTIDEEAREDVDLRGFSGSRESYVAVRNLLIERDIRPPVLVTNHFHRFLAPYTDNILSGLQSICVIGPYKLEAQLSERYGIERVKTHLIPNQNSSSGEGSRWFPDHFDTLCQAIDPQRDGQVYLVAAGLLAKPMSALIKARGGIALDIGSMIDVWAGRSVRKYHDASFLESFALQK